MLLRILPQSLNQVMHSMTKFSASLLLYITKRLI